MTWQVGDVPPLAPPPPPWTPGITRKPVPRCQSESPAWGWEGEGERCQRAPHDDDPWHYWAEADIVLWWRGDQFAR